MRINKEVEFPKSYLAWDLETSGFDPKTNKILEIGMMKIYNGECIEERRWVLNNNIEIPEEITKINGMTKAIIDAEGKDPKTCIQEFVEILQDSQANLTHNGVKFDIPFLIGAMKEIPGHSWKTHEIEDLQKHLNKTAIDTAMIYKAHINGLTRMWNENFHDFAERVGRLILRGKYNLGVCCDELGIDRSKVVQHRALGDVLLTHEVLKAMNN